MPQTAAVDSDALEYRALGLDRLVASLVDEAMAQAPGAERLSDHELAGLAGLLRAVAFGRRSWEVDAGRLECALEQVFTPMWQRYVTGAGEPLVLLEGICAVNDCRPSGLAGFGPVLAETESEMVDALVDAKGANPLFGLAAVEISARMATPTAASQACLRRAVDGWTRSLADDGRWSGLPTDEALRRIRVLAAVGSVDAASRAFGHYAGRVIVVERMPRPGSGVRYDDLRQADDIRLGRVATYRDVGLLADCYFSLHQRDERLTDATRLTPAHLIRVALTALEAFDEGAIPGELRFMLHALILRATHCQAADAALRRPA